MQWSDAVRRPSERMLRQFAALCLGVFVGMAAWRAARGQIDAWTWGVGVAGTLVGMVGLVWPARIRWLYTGWMVAAFPIGWAISWLMLVALFYVIFLPVGLVFRLMGRDALALRPPAKGDCSLWLTKQTGNQATDYFRQF